MTAPNILNLATATAKTTFGNLTTIMSNVIVNSVNSNSVDKLNTILVTNYSSTAITSNVWVNRSGTNWQLVSNIGIPAYSMLTVLAKDIPIYLEEGDYLQANASGNVSAHITTCYELMA